MVEPGSRLRPVREVRRLAEDARRLQRRRIPAELRRRGEPLDRDGTPDHAGHAGDHTARLWRGRVRPHGAAGLSRRRSGVSAPRCPPRCGELRGHDLQRRRCEGRAVNGDLFDEIEDADREAARAQLPEQLDRAVPLVLSYLRDLDACVKREDIDGARRFGDACEQLANRLNGGTNFGVLAEDGAGTLLEERTRATEGTIPLWGQVGSFVVTVKGCRVRVELDGVFGISFPAFGAHAVDWHKPFISETGFRSFLIGHHDTGFAYPGTPDQWAAAALLDYIESPPDSSELTSSKRTKKQQRPRGLVIIRTDHRPPLEIKPEPEVVKPEPESLPMAEVIIEQTAAIKAARAAALAEVPFALTPPPSDPDEQQPTLF